MPIPETIPIRYVTELKVHFSRVILDLSLPEYLKIRIIKQYLHSFSEFTINVEPVFYKWKLLDKSHLVVSHIAWTVYDLANKQRCIPVWNRDVCQMNPIWFYLTSHWPCFFTANVNLVAKLWHHFILIFGVWKHVSYKSYRSEMRYMFYIFQTVSSVGIVSQLRVYVRPIGIKIKICDGFCCVPLVSHFLRIMCWIISKIKCID